MKLNFIKSFCVTAIMTSSLVATAGVTYHAESVPGEYIVKFKSNVDLTAMSDVKSFASQGFKVVSAKHKTALVKREFLERKDFAIKTLNSEADIEYAEPNYIYRINRTPNDPELSQLWGLINTGENREGIDVGAQQAWDIQTGSRDVVVAVIDTGVDYTLGDLAPNMWTNDAELNGEEGVDDDGNGYIDDIHGYDFANTDADPVDDHGHGSHCSGTIGAKGNDGKGIVGVAWDVRIMALKFLTASGSGTLEGALKSIDYATTNGAKIMSNSWGGGGFSEALKEAIQRSHDAGALFVAAAGNHAANNDAQPTYPANYEVENVMSVAAIDEQGKLAGFSCFGKETVHVGAPGVNILSSTPGGYKSWSGTSMATPHVSGIAALLLSNEPSMSSVSMKERIIKTSKPVSGLRSRVASRGIANAYYALADQVPPADPNDPFNWEKSSVEVATPHPYEDAAKLEWTVSIEGANKIALHFKKFDTERSYDKLTIKDAQGNVIEIVSGLMDDTYSSPIPGDTAILVFESDSSVNKFGFEIDTVAFQ